MKKKSFKTFRYLTFPILCCITFETEILEYFKIESIIPVLKI